LERRKNPEPEPWPWLRMKGLFLYGPILVVSGITGSPQMEHKNSGPKRPALHLTINRPRICHRDIVPLSVGIVFAEYVEHAATTCSFWVGFVGAATAILRSRMSALPSCCYILAGGLFGPCVMVETGPMDGTRKRYFITILRQLLAGCNLCCLSRIGSGVMGIGAGEVSGGRQPSVSAVPHTFSDAGLF